MDAVRWFAQFLRHALFGQHPGNASPAPATTDAAELAGEAPAAPSDPKKRPRRRDHEPGFRLNCGAPDEVGHVGIVFVHGIGSQEAGATLLEWSSKIIALLLDARASQEAKGDPVIDVQLDRDASSRFIELRLPKAKARDGTGTIPEQHWVMTEAWWAERVRPPAFGEMAEWLGPRGAITRIVTAMLPRPSNGHDPRRRPAVQVNPLIVEREPLRLWDLIRRRWDLMLGRDPTKAFSKYAGKLVVKEPGKVGDVYGETETKTGTDEEQKPLVWPAFSDLFVFIVSIASRAYFQAISSLLLVVYGALRSVEKILPIGPLKNGALTRPIDRFILEWFGDVYVLLQEPAQAASVRGRLIEALRDLEWNQCEPVNIVAHSGGAIVSYMTLTDEAQQGLRVDRLITIGEGLNLAWRLLARSDGTVTKDTKLRYDRLYSDPFALRKDLEWHDFWASQDPAPVGVLAPEVTLLPEESLKKIHSHAIWNRLAFREDHGTYWDNDEEFLIPAARLMDRNPENQRLYRNTEDDRKRSIRRRRRLTFLSIWRQLALVAPAAAIVTAYVVGSTYVVDVGRAINELWLKVPGNQVITGPIDAIRAMGLNDDEPWQTLGEAGVWVIAAILVLLTLVSLVAPPERPVPWNNPSQPWWRPFNLFSWFLRVLPLVVAGPVLGSVIVAARSFMGQASNIGLAVGLEVLAVLLIVVVVAVAAHLVFHSRWKGAWPIRWAADGVRLGITIVVMVVVAALALAPFVAVLIFEEVGTRVLGIATVIVAFQLIARIGTWRWAVWDGRERVAVRTQEPGEAAAKDNETKNPIRRWLLPIWPRNPNPYPPLFRILVQMTLLVAAVLTAFVAIVYAPTLTIWAVMLAALTVLLGVAVDVMDSERGLRRDPGSMADRQLTL